jgi:hypothetical protein
MEDFYRCHAALARGILSGLGISGLGASGLLARAGICVK